MTENSQENSQTDRLGKVWWLGVPLLVIAAQLIIENTLPYQTLGRMHSENGPHEFVQFIVLAAAFITALIALLRCPVKRYPALGGWLGLAAVCCFYVTGEEISWGQHIFGWATPEFWEQVNDQQETNLHNTSSWLDQKPRLILEIGVIFGGLILPLLMKYKPDWVPKRFALIYPPSCLAVVAGIVFGLKLVDMILEDTLGVIIFQRGSEVIELYLYYFVLLYLIVMKRRVEMLRQTAQGAPPA